MHENCVSKEEFEKVVSELKIQIKALIEENIVLKARLARYENPHTPPSMRINTIQLVRNLEDLLENQKVAMEELKF